MKYKIEKNFMKELNDDKYFVCEKCGILQFSNQYVCKKLISTDKEEGMNNNLKHGEYYDIQTEDKASAKIKCKNCVHIVEFKYLDTDK